MLTGARTSFLGRRSEIATVADLLDANRLVTLTGPPGIGKTRLALQVAARVGNGDCPTGFAELAAVAGPTAVPLALASALSIQEVSGRSVTDALVARLGRRRLLLVLDNCEHVLTACTDLVNVLLRECPALTVLATSREPLSAAGERVWRVPPLGLPPPGQPALPETLARCEAVALFVERARAVQASFSLNSYVAADVAEICTRLDGVPLAIELAAARVEVFTSAEIASRLDDRFALLGGAGSGEPGRHRTLQAALDWSHDLLAAPERALLRRLSVFAGSFGAEAAEGVCSGAELKPGDAGELLERLVSRSLVVAEGGALPPARYRLLETIRAYGSVMLEEAREVSELREAHAAFHLELAETAEPQLTGAEQERWFELLDTERPNLRLALEWTLGNGRGEWALRLAGALVVFWRVRCHFTEGRDFLAAALAADDGAAPDVRAKALWGAGFLTLMSDDGEGAIAAVEQALDCFRELGDMRGQARALLILGSAKQYVEVKDPTWPSRLEESAALAQEVDDPWCRGHALGVAGYGYILRGEPATARPLLEQAIAVARKGRDKQGLRYALLMLGVVAKVEGDYRSAEPLLEESLGIADDLGEEYTKATALRHLGQVAFGRGRYARAGELLDGAISRYREVGPAVALIIPLVVRARVARAQGDGGRAHRLLEEAMDLARRWTDAGARIATVQALGELVADERDLSAARALFEEALSMARSGDSGRDIAQALYALGDLARIEGDLRRATALHNEALGLHREAGNPQGIAVSLEAVAGLTGVEGRCRDAALLLGAAHALREEKGYVRTPAEAARHESDVAEICRTLSADEFGSAFSQGTRLSIDEAVGRARNGRGGRGRAATGWFSLTESEQRVADLVAEGLMNTEIAERLVISPWTVKTHLSNIFRKLGITRRTELAREVTRRGAMSHR